MGWSEISRAASGAVAQLSQVYAQLVDVVRQGIAEDILNGSGFRSYAHWLEVTASLSPVRAKEVVDVAKRADEFPELMHDMREGLVSLDQAAAVVRHTPAEYAEHVSNLARHSTVRQVRRLVTKWPWQVDESDAEARSPESPDEEKRPASLSMGYRQGRFTLRFDAPALDAAVLEQAIREAKDALFDAGDPKATLADGLIEAASRSLGSIESPARRDHYRVLVHLRADGTGWLHKQGALPAHVIEKLTCDGTLKPVWLDGAKPVSVGRAIRIIPTRTRQLVEDRDGGCRYPGCPVTGFLENHHLQHWSRGGASDVDSVISLCPRHHREHHQDLFTIGGHPDDPDGLVFRHESTGVIIGRPPPSPPVTHPPPGTPATKGYPLVMHQVDMRPNGEGRIIRAGVDRAA